MKTRDGYDVTIGMWLSDDQGTYVVESIRDDGFTRMREMDLNDDGDWQPTEKFRWLVPQEVKQLYYIW